MKKESLDATYYFLAELNINQIIADSRFDNLPAEISLFDAFKYMFGSEETYNKKYQFQSTFTLHTLKSDVKFVYTLSKDKVKKMWWLSLIHGNETLYMGTIDIPDYLLSNIPNIEKKLILRKTEKSRKLPDSPEWKLFATVLEILQYKPENIAKLLDKLKIYHDGSCSLCGRPLTDLVSLAVGGGTKCMKAEQKQYRIEAKKRGIVLPKPGKAGVTLNTNIQPIAL